MSKNVAGLYDALKYVLLIEPVYYVKWSTLKKLIICEIPAIIKDRGILKNLFQ